MLYPADKPGAKPIGEKMALHICHIFVLPLDWFNRDDDGEIIQINKENNNDIVINVLNVEASAGYGSNGDVIQIIRQIRYNPEQYYELYRGMNPESVEIISIKGDSMNPTFSHGDLLFVDISVQEYDGDGIYVFTYDNHTFVKRIQKTGSKFTVISDNPRYKEWDIEQECFIHGKVKVHQSQQLNFIG